MIDCKKKDKGKSLKKPEHIILSLLQKRITWQVIDLQASRQEKTCVFIHNLLKVKNALRW